MTGSNAETADAIPDHVPRARRLAGDPSYAGFEKVEVVGTGGNAVVYGASPGDDSDRLVALKEPHEPGAVGSTIADRFRTEAETWASIDDHDHVVSVLAWDTDPHPWLALEFMDGGNLAARTGECCLPRALWIGACVAGGVDYAHRNGIVHLDLKPENVLFRATPGEAWAVPKVADWGLSRLLQAETVNLEGLSPRYAAPEQLAPDSYGPIGPRTDVYQLGVVLYELLVGDPPFGGPAQVLRDAVIAECPPAPSGRNPSLPADVDDLLDRALAKDPANRYDSMCAFREELTGELARRTAYDPTDDATPPSSESSTESERTASGVKSPYERALTLADEGFVQLSEQFFARRDPVGPLAAWRRGVTLVDAYAGRAIDRVIATDRDDGEVDDPRSHADGGDADGGDADGGDADGGDADGGDADGGDTHGPPERTDTDHEENEDEDEDEDEEHTALTDRLITGLLDGVDHVVLGPPGSGKSTVCKQVACEWFDRGAGPVFYRESGQDTRFDRPSALARRVTETRGHALVVVEDAVRPEAQSVFEFLDLVADSGDVTVLLDAREGEWREADPGPAVFGSATAPTRRGALEPVYVPRPDTEEHERFVRAVEEATDRSIDVDVEQLQADIRQAAASDPEREQTQPGELFYLLHRLTALAGDPLANGETPTTLTDDVADVYGRLADQSEVALDVGVCVNVLAATGVGVHPELLYAVGFDDPLAVENAIDVLDGRVVFPREADWSQGTTAYPAIHGAWSTAFLAYCLEAEDETDARERFGRVSSRVLGLADDEAARERVAETLRADTPYLARIEADPAAWVDETVESIYALGRERPKLAPLFGDGRVDSVELPAACSASVVEERPVWLGRMFQVGGYFDRAERAFERLDDADTDRAVERLLGLARVAKQRGDFDAAVAYAEECLTLVEDDDRPRDLPLARARVHLRLGQAVRYRDALEAASTHFRAALEEFRTVEDRRWTATTLNSLGIVAGQRGNFDRAREYFERSLAIERELGDRKGVVNSLNNLGNVAGQNGEYDRARGYHERSLEIKRELGDRSGEANSLNNLGNVARVQGEYDRARDYLERSLDIVCELGGRQAEANTLTNLGAIARMQGEYHRAVDHLERSLEIVRELGDRKGAAEALGNLGAVAIRLGELDRARELLQRSIDVASEAGAPIEASRSQYRLGELARHRGEYDRAREYFERALATVEDGGDHFETTKVRLARGRLALARGRVDLARERAFAALEAFAEVGARHWEARCRRLLGRVGERAGDRATAREHWRVALDTFEDVGAPQDALAVLEHLVADCREAGEDHRAEQFCRHAAELLGTVPDPVADRAGAWVPRACSAIEGG